VAPNPRLTHAERMTLRGIAKVRLAAGWVPWVRPKEDGSGEEEVWARSVDGVAVVARPISPAESEQVSQIMGEG